jgi:glycosyltransferase involved in cell wall biosynthesis
MSTSEPTVVLDVSAVHPTAGGGHTYAHLLTRHLPAAGIKPVCLVRTNENADDWDGCQTVSLVPRIRPLRLLWEQTRLLNSLERNELTRNAHVLHSTHYTMPERPRSGLGLARLVTIHDLTYFSHPQSHDRSKQLFFRRAINVAARYADQLICVSESTAEQLVRYVDVRVPVEVIPHGIDQQRFTRAEPREHHDTAILRTRNINGPYILHLGTIEPRKNIARLIEAVDAVRKREQPDLQLVLAGGAWAGERESLPKPDGLTIRHLGIVGDEEVPALLRRALCVAYPSLAEGYGLPAVEALACGSPLVTSKGSVMETLVGEAAVLADPLSIDSLADALRLAIRGEGPGAAVRARMAAGFDASTCANRHADLYRRHA